MADNSKNPEKSPSTEKKQFWNNDMEAIIGIVVVLLILGTINVFSSSFILGEDDPYHFLTRHLFNVAISLIAFGVGFKYDYRIWRQFMPYILAISFISLILVLVLGDTVNGATRWLSYKSVNVQPAEFCKLVSIMIMAAYLSWQIKNNKKIEIFTPQMGIVIALAALTELEPDMGTASIIAGIPVIMLIVAGLERKKVGYMLGGVLVLAALLIAYQPYRLDRLKVVFDPWSDAQNVGYQTVQSLSAIGSGELTGMGLGVGVSKYDYLPEAHTDFAFAIFCQENGFLGAIFVFTLFAAFAVYAARIARIARDEYGQILAMGIMILIVGQAIGNLFMVGGMFPVVGIPLPFISYGGTSLIVTMAAVGILVNIGRKGKKK